MEIIFNGTDRRHWIQIISEWQDVSFNNSVEEVLVKIQGVNDIEELQPIHFVLLACLRQRLKDIGYRECYLLSDNPTIKEFLFKDINLGKFWLGNKPVNHTDSSTETIFNLWRIIDVEMEFYAHDIVKYLNNRFFNKKDLSAVKQALLEVFYNIFDHADAKGNAFSFMKYDKKTEVLSVAICDFGKGIAQTIKSYFTHISDDKEAILKATEDMVTIQSKSHNKGMGLGEIIRQIQDGGSLRILSNSALVVCKDSVIESYDTEFQFNGTLIYYDIMLSNFDNLEEIDNFALDF